MCLVCIWKRPVYWSSQIYYTGFFPLDLATRYFIDLSLISTFSIIWNPACIHQLLLCLPNPGQVGLVGGRYPYPTNVNVGPKNSGGKMCRSPPPPPPPPPTDRSFSGLAGTFRFPAPPFHKSWIRHWYTHALTFLLGGIKTEVPSIDEFRNVFKFYGRFFR